MKITSIKDIDSFFKVVDSCKGKVELRSDEGDCLNIKSSLSKYVGYAELLSGGELKNLEIVAYEPEDVTKLFNYFNKTTFKLGDII